MGQAILNPTYFDNVICVVKAWPTEKGSFHVVFQYIVEWSQPSLFGSVCSQWQYSYDVFLGPDYLNFQPRFGYVIDEWREIKMVA